jgi:PEP-CTERM motif
MRLCLGVTNMNTFRMNIKLRGRLVTGLFAACGLLFSAGASAVINDDPYFDLYPNGDGTTAIVCGSSGCADDLNMIVNVLGPNGGAGSGNRDTFLRVAQNEPPGTPGSATTESAYNTDDNNLQNDGLYTNQAKDTTAGNGDDFNNAVLIGDLETITINGVDYYGIVLDVNEPGGGKEFIRLDEFEVYLSTTGSINEYDPGDGSTPGDGSFADNGLSEGLVFDMDYWDTTAARDSTQTSKCVDPDPETLTDNCGGFNLSSLNSAGRNGSGDEDYEFLIPVALFEAAAEGGDVNSMYMHVVATFGAADAGEYIADPIAYAEANFEEFAAITGKQVDVPVPATVLLMGLGLLGLRLNRRAAAA